MISPELLEILRCPLDPARARLELSEEGLVCTCCKVVYPIREGIPCLLIDEARLPEGCASVNALPCRKNQPR